MLDTRTTIQNENHDISEETDESDWEIASDIDTISVGVGEEKNGNRVSNYLPNCENKDNRPTFGNIAVNKSTDIHFGNKTYYNGPVTIKQYVYSNSVSDETNNSGSGVFPSPTHQCDSGTTSTDLSDLHERLHRLVNNKDFQEFQTPQRNKLHQDISRKLVLPKCIRESVSLRRWAFGLAVLVIATSAILTLIVLLYQASKSTSVPVSSATTYSSADDEYSQTFTPTDTNTTLSGKLRLITRREWLAQPPGIGMNELKLPVPYVIISHTATEPCSKQSDCVFQIRTIQTFHIESRGWSDIAYNFLVGGDGYAYVGRGWDKEGAHAYGFNRKSIGISFVGTFTKDTPPSSQLLAAKQLIELGVNMGKISPDYKLLAHRQVSQTESPGDALFDILKTWPHWSERP